MDNNEQFTLISNIINNDKLRGSLYSTFRCSYCGKKMIAKVAGQGVYFSCENYTDIKSYNEHHGRHVHDSFALSLTDVVTILNFNPLL